MGCIPELGRVACCAADGEAVALNRFALGALGTLAWLDAEGCTDVRVRLTDYNEVSAD